MLERFARFSCGIFEISGYRHKSAANLRQLSEKRH